MVRTPCSDKSGLKKGTWTPEEDRKLVAYVTRYGYWNWRQLPKFAGLARCGKSCRLRWMNYLRPDIKRGNYTQGEEETIIRLHEKLGNRWSTISAHLPGRTDNEIKNHWHTILKKRFLQNSDTKGKAEGSKSKDQSHQTTIESRKERDLVTNTSPSQCALADSQIPDTCSMNYQPCSSEFSSITTDTAASSNGNWVLEDDLAFLDAFTEPMSVNFWTEPFMVDISYVPSEALVSEPEYFSPASDIELWSQNNLYEECFGLF